MASEDHSGLIQAVESSDVTYLTKFPGVGKKTAQQMILDLKGKFGELSIDTPFSLFDEAIQKTLPLYLKQWRLSQLLVTVIEKSNV